MIAIANQGAPLHSVAFTTRRSTLAIVSDKKEPLTKPADLVGNRIGIPSEGGTSETTLDLLIASNGIDPRDVPRQVTGFTPGPSSSSRRAGSRASSSAPRRSSSSASPSPTRCSCRPPTTSTTGRTTSPRQKGLREQGDDRRLHARSRARCSRSSRTRRSGYADTIKKLRSKYDFDELKNDSVAKAYLDFNVGSWVIDGEDKLLKTNPEKWKATYDAAVKIKAAKAGVDVTKNLSPPLV